MGYLGAMFGGDSGNEGDAGMNFKAGAAPILNTVDRNQLNTAQTTSNDALAQQQTFLDALRAQNGIGNQSAVFGQQQALANQLQGVANGTGPNPAMAQLNQTTGANIANQAAMAAGQRGASANVGLLARQAGQQGGAIQQQAVGQGATMAANQQIAGMSALAGQQANMGNMATNQVNQQAAATTGYLSAAQQEQANLLNAAGALNNANVGSTGSQNSSNASVAGVTAQNQGQFMNKGLNAMGNTSMVSGMMGGGGAYGGNVSKDLTPMSKVLEAQGYAAGGNVVQQPASMSAFFNSKVDSGATPTSGGPSVASVAAWANASPKGKGAQQPAKSQGVQKDWSQGQANQDPTWAAGGGPTGQEGVDPNWQQGAPQADPNYSQGLPQGSLEGFKGSQPDGNIFSGMGAAKGGMVSFFDEGGNVNENAGSPEPTPAAMPTQSALPQVQSSVAVAPEQQAQFNSKVDAGSTPSSGGPSIASVAPWADSSSGGGGGGGGGGGSSMMSLLPLLAMMSDKNVKKDIKSGDGGAKKFMDKLDPKQYQYKDDKNGKGEQLGVMAQDMEKADPSLVKETGEGKAIDYSRSGGQIMAALANLNKRLEGIESSKNKMAAGGKVAAMLSPGEIYLPPDKAKKVAEGKGHPMKEGKRVPGQAKVKGDSLKNDTVPARLDAGGIVIPRSILEGNDPAGHAIRFVRAHLSSLKKGK